MRRLIYFFLIGVFFGIVLFKSEAASWFRIYEMFQFDSFHMYGIIGSAFFIGVIFIQVVKQKGIKSFLGNAITIADKEKKWTRYIIGGLIFGMGWALAGACPGPIFALIGSGFLSLAIVLLSAIVGTFLYGVLRKKLPH